MRPTIKLEYYESTFEQYQPTEVKCEYNFNDLSLYNKIRFIKMVSADLNNKLIELKVEEISDGIQDEKTI